MIIHSFIHFSTVMSNNEIIEYTNRTRMEQTTAKVFARLNQMKKTSPLCVTSSTNDITSEDTISTISADSGVSTLFTDFSHSSPSSMSSLLHRTAASTCHLRCDPSIINFLSHHLMSSERSIIDLSSTTIEQPLAESSRQFYSEHDQTIIPDDDDDPDGPLTSTLIDRWYKITRTYSATFREDLSVRKNELVQIIRCSHPHWIWVRNEDNQEGFIPSDCLVSS